LVPQFFAPQLTPVQLLIISSPSQRKVVYTELKNFKSKQGRTFALIDSGLDQPCGIAVDKDQGHLYVADRGAKGIYRYTLIVTEAKDRDGGTSWLLSTTGNRLTVLANHVVEWVAVNDDGDVFYSDQGSNNINRITAELMSLVETGAFQAEDLQVVSEKERASAAPPASVAAPNASDAPRSGVADPDEAAPNILAIYESELNARVSKPAGIVSDGLRLYWANQADGLNSGSVCQGEVNPHIANATAAPAAFPSKSLSNVTDAAYGVTKTNNLILFSGIRAGATAPEGAASTAGSGEGTVYGRQLAGGDTYVFASGLGRPRALVWDSDHTVFVADEAAGGVMSFPAGRVIENVPLTQTVNFQGAYGLALLQASDKAFSLRGGAMRRFGRAGASILQLLAPLAALAALCERTGALSS
jgi:sugar lactone lactonase YvrE